MKNYLLALDQGTTSSRAILFDKAGRIAGKGQHTFPQYYPKQGWVEHDAMEIWSSQISVAAEAMVAAQFARYGYDVSSMNPFSSRKRNGMSSRRIIKKKVSYLSISISCVTDIMYGYATSDSSSTENTR